MQNTRAKVFKYHVISQSKLHSSWWNVRVLLGYSKCSKWRPLTFTQQRRRLRHWLTASSMILCCKPDHSAIRRRPSNYRILLRR